MTRPHPSQILVVRLSSVGDVLLATPLVRVLRREYPRARLRFLVKPEYAELLRFNPHVDQVLVWPSKTTRDGGGGAGVLSAAVGRLVRELRSPRPLWVVDLQASPRSRAFVTRLRAQRRFTYRKDYVRRQLLLKVKVDAYPDPPESMAERYFAAVAQLGLQPDGRGLDLIPGEAAERRAAEALGVGTPVGSCGGAPPDAAGGAPEHGSAPEGGGWLAVAPGARWATKRWPAESFAAAAREIAERHGMRVAVLGAAGDAEPARVVADLLRAAGVEAVDLAGRLTLVESAAVMACCAAVLANDSGLLHAAAALRVPAVALFGSTVSEFGFAPYRSPARVLGVEGLPCRPCTHYGRSACPLGHFACMRRIDPRVVAGAALELLSISAAASAAP